MPRTLNDTRSYEVKPVLNSMLSVDPKAEYYTLIENNVVLFVREYFEEEQEWEIDGKYYSWLGTGTIQFFENEERNGNALKEDIQLSLF